MLCWVGGFLYHISPDVIGVLIAGFWIQSIWTRRENQSAWIENLTDEMKILVEESLEYWSLDYSDGAANAEAGRARAQMLEPRIKGGVYQINSQLRRYSERYQGESFDALMRQLYDSCTGGGFESHRRGPQRERYIGIINSTLKIRWQLFQRQTEMPISALCRRLLSQLQKPFAALRRRATEKEKSDG